MVWNIRNKPVVSRRDYSRRINGTAAGQTHNQMDVVGSVHIHPDGRVVQILHLKHFRDFWFELEDASVGYGEGIRGIQVNLQLWTAMPNKVLSVQPQLIRATHPTSSVVYGQGEAAEHICAWDLRKQGNSRDRVIIDMSRFRQTDYPEAEDYLEGIEVVCESFHTLLPKFQHDSKTLFVLDPPYLCTRQDSYKQATYFDLIDFLRLIHLTRPPYIFFSSTKSEFVRFVEYMQEVKMDNWQSFEGAQREVVKATLNYQVRYEDNLVFKF